MLNSEEKSQRHVGVHRPYPSLRCPLYQLESVSEARLKDGLPPLVPIRGPKQMASQSSQTQPRPSRRADACM